MAKHGRSSAVRATRRVSQPARPPARALASSTPPSSQQAASARAIEPAPASPPVGFPAPEAVRCFEAGIDALQRRHYTVAAEALNTLLARFPAERALLDRARVYLALCERELRRRPTQPTTPEERLTAATAALNNGDEARAEGFVEAVLAEQPEQDLALYLSAAIHARRGRRDDALAQLRQAIALSPDVAAQAALDPDFDFLRDCETFHALTAPAAPLPRRARRMRR
jgi:tetratricopeptide (TPR) repeat protein